MIVIVDYGLGNLGSIKNMFKKAGADSIITSDLKIIEQAEKIILPGVGQFDAAMEKILTLGLYNILEKKALIDKIPILGICLGMQLLTNGSEEGKHKGFGWIDAYTTKFYFQNSTGLKIPHMGWNNVFVSTRCLITNGFTEDFRFYFVHSYKVLVNDQENSILKTEYGTIFDSGIQKENIYGVQFHPEKSHRYGLKLFSNFIDI